MFINGSGGFLGWRMRKKEKWVNLGVTYEWRLFNKFINFYTMRILQIYRSKLVSLFE